MKVYLTAVLASLAAAYITDVPVPTTEQKDAWKDEAVAALSDSEQKDYKDRVLVKRANGLSLDASEQAVADKVDESAANKETEWIKANTRTMTSEVWDQVQTKARSGLTENQKVALMSRDSKFLAGNTNYSQDEKDAQAALD